MFLENNRQIFDILQNCGKKKHMLHRSTQSPGFALDQGAGPGRAGSGEQPYMGPPGSSLSAPCLSTAPVPRYLTCCCCSLLLLVGVSSSPLVLYSSPSPLSRNVFLSSVMDLSSLSEKISWWFWCSEQLFRRLEGGTEGVLEIRLPIQPFWRYGMEDWCMSICFFSSSFVSFELHFVSVSSWVLDRLIESTALRASSILLHIFAEKDCFWPLFLYGLGLIQDVGNADPNWHGS